MYFIFLPYLKRLKKVLPRHTNIILLYFQAIVLRLVIGIPNITVVAFIPLTIIVFRQFILETNKS